MNKQMVEVMQRRSELLSKIAAQRMQLSVYEKQWYTPLTLVDNGLSVVRFFRSKPMLVAGALALFVIRRRGVVSLLLTGWKIWRVYKTAKVFKKFLE